MANYETILVEDGNGIRKISLNRPQSLNAFTATMRSELLGAVTAANNDDAVKVVILTGEGRAFCAGADLTEEDGTQNVEDRLNDEYKPPLMAIYNAPKPYIAAVKGAAAGIGSAYAMACDLIVMSKSGYLYQAFSAIGLIPDGGATWHLSRQLGPKRAYEMMVLGEKMKADTCLDLGLVNKVVADDSLLDEAMAYAQRIAERAPLSLKYTKQALREAQDLSLNEAFSMEAKYQRITSESEDFREGRAAFLEKRKPVWSGR